MAQELSVASSPEPKQSFGKLGPDTPDHYAPAAADGLIIKMKLGPWA